MLHFISNLYLYKHLSSFYEVVYMIVYMISVSYKLAAWHFT